MTPKEKKESYLEYARDFVWATQQLLREGKKWWEIAAMYQISNPEAVRMRYFRALKAIKETKDA